MMLVTCCSLRRIYIIKNKIPYNVFRQRNSTILLVGSPVIPRLGVRNFSFQAWQHLSTFDKIRKIVLGLTSVCCAAYTIYRSFEIFQNGELNSEKISPIDTTSPPVPYPDNPQDIKKYLNRRVHLKGHYDYTKEIYVSRLNENSQSKQRSNKSIMPAPAISTLPGYHVLTPFVLKDSGKRILVNRGWISKTTRFSNKLILGQVPGELEFDAFVMNEEFFSIYGYAKSLQFHTIYRKYIATNPDIKKFDLKAFAQELNIDDCDVWFIADSNSTLPNGPIGGQVTTEPYYSLKAAIGPIVSIVVGVVVFAYAKR